MGRILLATNVINDGVGDFYHLLDVAKNTDLLPNFTKDILITTKHDKTTVENFVEELKKIGFENIIYIKNQIDIPDNMGSSNAGKTVFIYFASKGDEDVSNEIIYKFGHHYVGTLAVSADVFNSYDGHWKFNIPKLLITEHRGGLRNNCTSTKGWQELPMNFLSGTKSLFLTKENRDEPAKQLAKVLLKKENQTFGNAIFGNNVDLKNINEKCKTFLEQNLFVPCYFQHNASAIVNFMNLAIASPSTNKYPSAVFFVNSADIKLLKKMASEGFFSAKIKSITVRTPEGETEIANPRASQEAKKVKLISGYRIKDNSDYNTLFHCAQFFAGSSGDKTFEKVLSNAVFPFHIVHRKDPKHGKEIFLEDAISFNPLFHAVKEIDDLNYLLHTVLLMLEDNHSIHDIQAFLRENFKIPESQYPELIKKYLNTLRTGQPFVHAGVNYSLSNYRQKEKIDIAEIFINKIYKAKNTTKVKMGYKTFKSQVEQFLIYAEGGNSKVLKDFLDSLEVGNNATLVAMADAISDAIRNKKAITLEDRFGEERDFSCILPEASSTLLLELVDQEMLKFTQQYLDSSIAKISQTMDANFFKKWMEFCVSLQKSSNLHQILPRLAAEFFGKYLKEADIKVAAAVAQIPQVTTTSSASSVSSAKVTATAATTEAAFPVPSSSSSSSSEAAAVNIKTLSAELDKIKKQTDDSSLAKTENSFKNVPLSKSHVQPGAQVTSTTSNTSKIADEKWMSIFKKLVPEEVQALHTSLAQAKSESEFLDIASTSFFSFETIRKLAVESAQYESVISKISAQDMNAYIASTISRALPLNFFNKTAINKDGESHLIVGAKKAADLIHVLTQSEHQAKIAQELMKVVENRCKVYLEKSSPKI